jgi:hypothetical protein
MRRFFLRWSGWVLLLLGGGCGDYGPFVVTPLGGWEAPTIQRVLVEPTRFDLLGGAATLEAEVSDPDGDLEQVAAEVTSPEGVTETVVLTRSGEGAVFRGTYRVPGNTAEDEQARVYQVRIKASDRQGLEAVLEAGRITVEAAPRPPGPADW